MSDLNAFLIADRSEATNLDDSSPILSYRLHAYIYAHFRHAL